jgi:non-ribosomal peptide synthetase component E (peptide arylation enzyme)
MAKPGSTGTVSKPLMELGILDDDGHQLPAGQTGEVAFRSIVNFNGYWDNSEATRQAIMPDGFFRTGDLGYVDEDGYLFIVDRKKDIIIRGGENIPVKYVEDALYEDPRVRDAAIVAMPDPRLGERACAFVICRDGRSLDMKGMQHFLAERGVAKVYWPERLEVVTELPRTANGKIRKADLRIRLANEMNS